MTQDRKGSPEGTPGALALAFTIAAICFFAPPGSAQEVVASGQWMHINGDEASTRYSSLDQIDAGNFWRLQVEWEWDGETEGVETPINPRGLPIYVDGKLITTSGPKRRVVAMDAGTGETLWSWAEPETFRWEYSMRQNHGKGVAFAEVDGRGVVFISTPAFFLYALDADTGEPIEGWGSGIPLEGFPEGSGVDLVVDLIEGWGPWEDYKAEGGTYDPYLGIPLELGYITSSSPPMVVDGVVIVGNSAEQGYNQTRYENVPGDVLAYDARTGEMLWKFHVIPRPGEYGHETWESDAWYWSGNIGSWAPMSADSERGLVYIPTKGGVMDFYGGFRPGDNLFGNSVIALDVQTGERVWHYQLVRHDVWNFDTPVAPVLLDVTVDGERIPALLQASKQAFVYAFNRETGQPIWPIEDRPVPQSRVPGEQLAETQPFPTWPEPFDLQGRSENDLIDYTPEIRRMALEVAQADDFLAPLFDPPRHEGNEEGLGPTLICPGSTGGVNITGPPAADPNTGILFITSHSGCERTILIPGEESPFEQQELVQGETVARWARGMESSPAVPQHNIDGLPIWKGPQGRIVAVDMNSGEHLWVVPNGDAPAAEQETIRNHPLLEGVDGVMVNRGRAGHAAMLATPTMLMATGQTSEGTTRLFALDKATGERLGQVETPGFGRYGIMTYMHEGRQFVVLPVVGGYTALALPPEVALR